jgi:hypothetical protein
MGKRLDPDRDDNGRLNHPFPDHKNGTEIELLKV